MAAQERQRDQRTNCITQPRTSPVNQHSDVADRAAELQCDLFGAASFDCLENECGPLTLRQ